MFDSDLLSQCSNTLAISGFESNVRRLIREELAALPSVSSVQIFRSGNVLVRKDSLAADAPTVMLAAHMDEVGFMVQSLTLDGYVLVVPIGGWWNHTLPSQRVLVQSRSGQLIPGQMGSKPPHLLPESQRHQVLPNEALCVDVGASSAEELRALGIAEGCAITPDVTMQSLAVPHRWMGKAFDNRAGVYTMIKVMQELAEECLPCHLVAAGTVQEEVGTRGAKALSQECVPDLMLVLEGPPADDTMGMPSCGRMGELGAGVQVRLYDPTHITPPCLAAWVRELAEDSGLACQWAVRRSGGTDAAASYSNWGGAPAIVLGVPVRYIHSHNGILDDRDLSAMVKLTKLIVRHASAERVRALVDGV